MKRFNAPLPGWVTIALIVLSVSLSAAAATPTLYGQLISNASVTPSPAVTGFYGEAVVAQATGAPTAQPGNLGVTGAVWTNTGFIAGPTTPRTVGNMVLELNGADIVLGCYGSSQTCPLELYLNGTGSGRTLAIEGNSTQTLFIPASSTQPFTFNNAANTVANVVIPNAGGLESDTSGSTTLSYVPPVYTAAGAAVAGTEHIAHITGTFSASTGACGPESSGYYCATVTISGAAAFSSGGTCCTSPPSYSCTDGAWGTADSTGYWVDNHVTGGSVILVWMAASSPNTLYVGTSDSGHASSAFAFDCIGT